MGRLFFAIERVKYRALLLATLVCLLIGELVWPGGAVAAAQEVVKPQAAVRALPAFELPLILRARVYVLTTLAIAWFFFLGAALGSYLNVVIFRLPRGRTTGITKSRCPRCHHAIRPYDNIPVLSWLILRGKCRDCQSPIASRYVLVELLMGCTFVGLLCAEIFSGGANLPLREYRTYAAQPWIDRFAEWDLVGLFAFHALLLWLLLGWLLFRVDRVEVPGRFKRWAFATGAAAPLVWPMLRPVHFQNFAQAQVGVFVAAADGLLGWAAGWAMAMVAAATVAVMLHRPAHGPTRRAWRCELAGPLSLVGLFLGWQAAFSVATLTVLWICAGQFARLTWPQVARWPLAAAVLLATQTQLVAWSWLSRLNWWPGHASSLAGALAASAAVMLAAAVLGGNVPRGRTVQRCAQIDPLLSNK